MPSKSYRNCTALHRHFAHGVGCGGARDNTAPVTNFKRSTRIYRQNRALDRDRDGGACEQH